MKKGYLVMSVKCQEGSADGAQIKKLQDELELAIQEKRKYRQNKQNFPTETKTKKIKMADSSWTCCNYEHRSR